MFHEQAEPNSDWLNEEQEVDHENGWLQARAAIIKRLAQWVDTVGETAVGRLQVTQLVQQLSGVYDPASVQDSSPAVIDETLAGLAELTQDLTALRHDLKAQTKQSRTSAEKLTLDTNKVVAASELAIAHVARLNPPADRELTRPLVMMVIETDEALLRLQEAMASLKTSWSEPPAALPRRWFAQQALSTQHDVWLTAWNKQKQAVAGWVEGLRLTCERMTIQLRSRSIERIGKERETFDPNTMQVLEVQHSEHQPPGTVIRVLRYGYRQHDWIIRPAQVTTSSMESE